MIWLTLVPSALPFSAISTTNGAENSTRPGYTEASTVSVCPDSTRIGRLSDPPDPCSVSTCLPGAILSIVIGVTPAFLPSTRTLTPGGFVVIVTRPNPAGGGGGAGAAFAASASTFLGAGAGVEDGQKIVAAPNPTTMTATPAAIHFQGIRCGSRRSVNGAHS